MLMKIEVIYFVLPHRLIIEYNLPCQAGSISGGAAVI